jgi:hypothetical protein
MSTMLVVSLALMQLPASFEKGSVVLRGPSSWMLLSPSGVQIAEFAEIDGKKPTSLAALPDGSGVVFTGRRETAKDGLFLKQGDRPMQDLSISSGYHAWVAISPSGNAVVFAHHPADGSGPIGQHSAMANAQLWTRPIQGGAADAVQLTQTDGCKSAPSFVTEAEVVLGHSTCRGNQGLELTGLGTDAGVRTLVPQLGHFEMVSVVSPSKRLVAAARKNFGAFSVYVSTWPSMKEQRVLADSPRGQENPSLQWTADSKSVLTTLGGSVVRIDVRSGKRTRLADFKLPEAP